MHEIYMTEKKFLKEHSPNRKFPTTFSSKAGVLSGLLRCAHNQVNCFEPLQRNISLLLNDFHQSFGRVNWENSYWLTNKDSKGQTMALLTSFSPPSSPAPAPVNMRGKKCCWLLTGMSACSQRVESKPCIDYPNREEQCFGLLRFSNSSSVLWMTGFCTKHD